MPDQASREAAHDPGDPACIQHVRGAIYTRVLHICVPCRSTEDHSACVTPPARQTP